MGPSCLFIEHFLYRVIRSLNSDTAGCVETASSRLDKASATWKQSSCEHFHRPGDIQLLLGGGGVRMGRAGDHLFLCKVPRAMCLPQLCLGSALLHSCWFTQPGCHSDDPTDSSSSLTDFII